MNRFPKRSSVRADRTMSILPELFGLGLASVALGVGALVQGAVGFGLALVAAPLCVLIEPRLVPGPILAVSCVLTVLVWVRERRDMDLRGAAWALIGRVPGTVAGALILVSVSQTTLSVLFATIVLVGVLLTAVGPRVRPTPRTLLVAGALGGVMGTVASIGGPPMALVLQHETGARLRGTLAVYFTVGSAMSLAVLAGVGRFGAWEFMATAALTPGVLLGYLASRSFTSWLDAGRTRGAVLVVSATSALALMIRHLW